VNELIKRKLKGRTAVLEQCDIVSALVKRGLKRHEIFDQELLDFEPHYRKAGWEVDYDKPGYNESYEPTFTFTSK